MQKISGSGLAFNDTGGGSVRGKAPPRGWTRLMLSPLLVFGLVLSGPISFLGKVWLTLQLCWAYACGQRLFRNVFHVRCIRPDGSIAWQDTAYNMITNAGLNHILGVVWHADTQVTTWYMGLVDNSGFTAFAAADTAGSHGGWTEVTAYTASNRVAWSPGAASSQSITNGSTTNFTMNATKTVKGLFIISENTKGGTSGTLCSEAGFTGGNQTVNSGDTLQCTYTVNASSS